MGRKLPKIQDFGAFCHFGEQFDNSDRLGYNNCAIFHK